MQVLGKQLSLFSLACLPIFLFDHHPFSHLFPFPHSQLDKMHVIGISSLLLLAAGAVQAASSWSFDDGAVSISNKKGGEADKETYVQQPKHFNCPYADNSHTALDPRSLCPPQFPSALKTRLPSS